MTVLLSSEPSFELPPDIHDVLDQALVPADELNAQHRNTTKFFVDGHPDLFVRLNPGQLVTDALESTASLVENGVKVLPFHVVEHNGEEWVITKRVVGEKLTEAFSVRNGFEHAALIEEADLTWAGLGNNLIFARQAGIPAASDAESPAQHMFGVIDLDEDGIPKIRLVDLPEYSWPTTRAEMFGDMVLTLVNGIIELETAATARVETAREVATLAIDYIDVDESSPAKQFALGSRYVLSHDIILSDEEVAEIF